MSDLSMSVRSWPVVPAVRGPTSDVECYLVDVGRAWGLLCGRILDAYVSLARSVEQHGAPGGVSDEALVALVTEAFRAGKAALEQAADAMDRAARTTMVTLLEEHRALRRIVDAGGVTGAEARRSRTLEREIGRALRQARRELEVLAHGAMAAERVATAFRLGLAQQDPGAVLPALERALRTLARVAAQLSAPAPVEDA